MTAILEATNLNKTFGAVTAAKDVNVAVAPHEIVGIIGANGAGKTTFVNMVTGWLPPTSGTIRFDGRDITGLAPRKITRLGICRSFQVAQVFMTATVFDNLLIALGIADSHGFSVLQLLRSEERAARADAILRRYRIHEYRDQVASTLPQGIRKLLDIAMAMVAEPKILLLDEPTSGISVEEKFGLMDIVMSALKEDGVTVLFVEHDMEIVERYVSRVLAFYQGEIICDAPPAEALVDPKVIEFVIGDEPQGQMMRERAGLAPATSVGEGSDA
ncbi:ABC transporter ATP-binding protein [Thalassobaculum sp. OXR-137]|uniref:ABC transporter ATP-binding protein n=1 Tax=Thalassobaculum sp. OXR-137 TaxID=3100173 RepID=UPI002AC99085|nr:ABC transporter ATP-binding protein [Thalassobaculum sp. OXR-137]WPZ33386.1 ABC transporter ATP-binding protein [Thalassobaculum sp. OXR-137]